MHPLFAKLSPKHGGEWLPLDVTDNINILPLDEGVRVDKHTSEKITTQDEVEGDNFFTEWLKFLI